MSWIHRQDYDSPENLGVVSRRPNIHLLSLQPDTSGHSLSLKYQVSGGSIQLLEDSLSFLDSQAPPEQPPKHATRFQRQQANGILLEVLQGDGEKAQQFRTYLLL